MQSIGVVLNELFNILSLKTESKLPCSSFRKQLSRPSAYSADRFVIITKLRVQPVVWFHLSDLAN